MPEDEMEKRCICKKGFVNHDRQGVLIKQSTKTISNVDDVEDRTVNAKLNKCRVSQLPLRNNVEEKQLERKNVYG